MISCQSVRVKNKYIVPDITFPQFPELEREVHEDGSWTIPKSSVDLLAEYYTRIQEAEEDYNDIKVIYEKENAE